MKLFIKSLSVAMGLLLMVLLTFGLLGRVSLMYFWVYAIVTALFAYKVLPKLNEKNL